MNKLSWFLAPRWPYFWPVILAVLAACVAFYLIFLMPHRAAISPWYCAEFTTDNGFHPVHLAAEGNSGPCDLLMVKNLSSKPLCVYAFSSRPKNASTAEEVMPSWARWITVSKQAVTVGPGCTWVMKPGDTGRLPFLHGNTWLTCFFEPAAPGADPGRLPAAQLPDDFRGRFQAFYVPSSLEPYHLLTPQLYLSEITALLAGEADSLGRDLITFPPQDIRGHNGLTSSELD